MSHYSGLYILNAVPSADENKTENNVANTFGFYFNFRNRGIAANTAANGRYKKVLLNFVKKFQYPNPRAKESCDEPYVDGIYMAPLRSILKLLYIFYLNDGTNGYLTQDEITNFIFYNSDVAKNKTPNYFKVFNDIKNFRNTKIFPASVETDSTKKKWKGMDKYNAQLREFKKYQTEMQKYNNGERSTEPRKVNKPNTNYERRQIGILLSIMKEAGCIEENEKGFFFSTSEKSSDVKKCIFEIMVYNQYWEYNPDPTLSKKDIERTYYEYMEMEEAEEWKMQQQSGKASKLISRNRIIFGAPGTGKSYTLNDEIKNIIQCDENGVPLENFYERVTFYPSYTYSQFIGAYKPKPKMIEEPILTDDSKIYKKEIISYEFVPGPFTRILVKALKEAKSDQPQNCLLVIEEINRANAAAVFGDIFQLLDRKTDGSSVYSIETSEEMRAYIAKELEEKPEDYAKIEIPSNLYIWATMNSADQGVTPLDTAFKRRWDFQYVKIDEGEFAKEYLNKPFTIKGIKTSWNLIRKEINRLLQNPSIKLSEDKLMGPFFLGGTVFSEIDDDKFEVDAESTVFNNAFKSKVLMYLFDDAVKSRRSQLFDAATYAQLCDDYDEIGLKVFKAINIEKLTLIQPKELEEPKEEHEVIDEEIGGSDN